MKRGFAILGAVIGTAAVGGGVVASRYEAVAAPNARIGLVSIGGLNREQAAFRLRQWWETEKAKPIALAKGEIEFPGRPSQFGITLDDAASVEQVDFRDLWEVAADKLGGGTKPTTYPVKFREMNANYAELKAWVEKNGKPRTPARAYYKGKQIVRIPEVAGESLDIENVPAAAMKAMAEGGSADVPILTSEKRVPDASLAKISGIVAQFTTRFSEGNRPRASNIRTAAGKIHGMVLAPGEAFSFNDTVGRRTEKAGFREAGVYINGRHDTDFGGGICQVSTTLYNAGLVANLDIVSRASHSLPVPYVPVGRDATVDYGNIDLKLRNPYDFPISLCTTVQGGSITWRVLGQPQPNLKVEIVLGRQKTWDVGTETVKDPTLAIGRTKVVEGGAMGRSLASWRVVYLDGKEIKRETLPQSYYRGAKRVIAVGTKPAPAPAPSTTASPAEAPPVETAPSTTTPVSGGG